MLPAHVPIRSPLFSPAMRGAGSPSHQASLIYLCGPQKAWNTALGRMIPSHHAFHYEKQWVLIIDPFLKWSGFENVYLPFHTWFLSHLWNDLSGRFACLNTHFTQVFFFFEGRNNIGTGEGSSIKLGDNGFSLGQKLSPHMSQLILEVIRTKGKPHRDDRGSSTDLLYLIIHISTVTSLSRVHNNSVSKTNFRYHTRRKQSLYFVSWILDRGKTVLNAMNFFPVLLCKSLCCVNIRSLQIGMPNFWPESCLELCDVVPNFFKSKHFLIK